MNKLTYKMISNKKVPWVLSDGLVWLSRQAFVATSDDLSSVVMEENGPHSPSPLHTPSHTKQTLQDKESP